MSGKRRGWLTDVGERSLSREEIIRRRRDVVLIGLVATVFIVLTVFEIRLPQLSRSASPASNVTFFLLINLNVILLVLLIFLVTRNLVKLVIERRRGIFGTGLRTKLVVSFVTLTGLPTILLFFVAQRFLNSAIENWFSARVEKSLESASSLAEAYYQQAGNSLLRHARQLGQHIDAHGYLRAPREVLAQFIESKRVEWDLEFVEVVVGPEAIAVARRDPQDTPDPLSLADQRTLLIEGKNIARTESSRSGDRIRVGVPIRNDEGTIVGAVIAAHRIPGRLSRAALNSIRAFQEFRALRVLEQPIENTYTLTFLLITLVVMFTATWFGLHLAKDITDPIQRLGEGMHEVAHGNLDHRAEPIGDREVSSLIGRFNDMASDLKAIHTALEERRRTIESILANITAGVVSIDNRGSVVTVNPAAGGMLGIRPEEALRMPWQEVFGTAALQPIAELIHRLRESGRNRIEGQVKLTGGTRELSAWVTATTFGGDAVGAEGILIFVEDVSHLQRVERMEAWREVARRIAHEIKNPLTPIQLSAQRLLKRYEPMLNEEERVVLDECTRTIIGQVEQLKRLVNEFSTFARLPSVELSSQDLNDIVGEALVLFREAHRNITFELFPDPEVPSLEMDRAAITRAVINMLDNAVAACRGTAAPRVEIRTQYDAKAALVRLEIADNGTGMTPQVKARAFEPYFSTKREGSGLGLAIVSAIAADHQAYVRLLDNEPRGTRIVIEFPVRTDSFVRAAARA